MALASCYKMKFEPLARCIAAPDVRCTKGMDATGEAADGAASEAQSACSIVARGFNLRSERDAANRDREAAGRSFEAVVMLALYNIWGEGSSASGSEEPAVAERLETKDQNKEVSNSAMA